MDNSVCTLQVQSVIYKNHKDSLLKAIRALVNSLRVYNRGQKKLKMILYYGDASPAAVLDERDIQNIQKMENEYFLFKYEEFGFNTGTAKGHNLLGVKCTSEFMMIMNPDIILEPSCLTELFKPFVNERVGMVEARQTPLEHAKYYDPDTGETEWASTACTVFKTNIYQQIKGFDANTFFMYCDDLDFSWRIRLAGYQIIYQPSAIVYHAKNLSVTGQWVPTAAEVYYSAEAAILLAYKWSNFERAESLVTRFMTYGGEQEQKAAREFEKRKKENRLPEPIDGGQQIAKFVGDEYCEMRFHYS